MAGNSDRRVAKGGLLGVNSWVWRCGAVFIGVALALGLKFGARPKNTPQLHRMVLVNRTHEYDNVHTFYFQPANGSFIQYEAGMYVHLVSPGSVVSKQAVRHMSFASAPGDDFLAFSMDLYSGSSFKQAMSELHPGGECQAFKVKFKHFAPAWPAGSQPQVVFLGGGVGMTAIRSLISQHGQVIDWRLVQVARDGKFLYAEELDALHAPQVRTNHAGAAAAVAEAVAERPGAWYYICGSDRFARGMLALLASGGVRDERIRVESFN